MAGPSRFADATPKADDAAGEDVHHDQNPITFEQNRFAPKEVDAAQAVLGVPDDGEPRRTITAWHRSVVPVEYASDDILIDLDSESSRYLLGNLAAAEAEVSPLHLDNRADEFSGQIFGSGAPSLSRPVEQAVLALHQGAVKAQ